MFRSGEGSKNQNAPPPISPSTRLRIGGNSPAVLEHASVARGGAARTLRKRQRRGLWESSVWNDATPAMLAESQKLMNSTSDSNNIIPNARKGMLGGFKTPVLFPSVFQRSIGGDSIPGGQMNNSGGSGDGKSNQRTQ